MWVPIKVEKWDFKSNTPKEITLIDTELLSFYCIWHKGG